jgi:uncharacterized membrane protein
MTDQTHIRLSPSDKFLEFLGIISLVALFALPFAFYSNLPDQIPSHYGMKGIPDAWSGKASIWTLPVIGFILYASLSALNYFLIMKGSGWEKQRNKQPIPREKILRLMQSVKLLLVLSFTYITWATIRVAMGNADGLGVWFIPTFMVLITFVPILFLLSGGGKK